VEAPDECGHQGETEQKVASIEKIDGEILAPVLDYLRSTGENFKILCLPDHPTPLAIRTHSPEPVPFFLYDSRQALSGTDFTEKACMQTGDYVPAGHELLGSVIEK
jgi:2,3-bisphosphoglycerate-independent phosphoglycerate mutase